MRDKIKKLYDTRDAAKYLTISTDVLHRSRKRGILLGRAAPRHVVLGPKSMRYWIRDLDKWISNAKMGNAEKEK